jgi:hypothetical protein
VGEWRDSGTARGALLRCSSAVPPPPEKQKVFEKQSGEGGGRRRAVRGGWLVREQLHLTAGSVKSKNKDPSSPSNSPASSLLCSSSYHIALRRLEATTDAPSSSRSKGQASGSRRGRLMHRRQGGGAAPRDREPQTQTPTKEISTAPVTAIGFASINVEIRTELEKRVLCPARANRFDPMGMTSELHRVRCCRYSREAPIYMQGPSWTTTDQPRTKSPEFDAPRPGCFNGVG